MNSGKETVEKDKRVRRSRATTPEPGPSGSQQKISLATTETSAPKRKQPPPISPDKVVPPKRECNIKQLCYSESQLS